MSKSNANALLQHLVGELNKLWAGQPSEIKTAKDAYEICRQIAEAAGNNTAESGKERTQWRIK